ncbi:MAG: hypothetical protein AABZ08_06245 [Planctomycetota bacterium]
MQDESEWVTAKSGHEFVFLPFVYDAENTKLTVSSATLKGQDAKSFVGIRLLAFDGDRLSMDGRQGAPIYETLEVVAAKANADGFKVVAQLAAPLRSRRGDAESRKGPSVKSRKDDVAPHDWAALVFELPTNAKQVSFEWIRGQELIDLDALRHAMQPISITTGEGDESENTDVMSDAVTECVSILADGPPTMAALAIHRLSKHRASWPRMDMAKWVANVDIAVLAAGGREEPVVRMAAWGYFRDDLIKNRPKLRLSPQVLDFFGAAEDELHLRWIENVECGLLIADGGCIWRVGQSRPRPGITPEMVALKLLTPLAHSEAAEVSSRAVTVLMNIQSSTTDLAWMSNLPADAQAAVVASLKNQQSNASRELVLKSLLRSPQPNVADALAIVVGSSGLRLRASDEPILKGWDSLETPADQASFLTVLAAADLRELLYTETMASMLTSAVAAADAKSQERQSIRQAAWTLAIGQFPRAYTINGVAGNHGSSKKSAPPDAFPVLVSRSAHDALIQTLADAARNAPRAIRSTALVALLQAGYSEEAARALLDSATSPNQRDVLLKELAAKVDVSVGRDSFTAMLGHLLKVDAAQNAALVLAKLAELRSKAPQHEQWRWAAALKAGIHFRDFDTLTSKLSGPTADAAKLLLNDLTRMSPEDVQRHASADKPEARAAVIDEADFRMGQSTAGRYGVVAVIECIAQSATDAESVEPKTIRWMPPTRRTVVLPSLTIEATEANKDSGTGILRVTADGERIGEGLPLSKPRPVGGPGRFSPALQAAQWGLLSTGKQNGPATTDSAFGPLVLQHRAVLVTPTQGTLTIDAAKYLKAALTAHHDSKVSDIAESLPLEYPMTLRYAHFGGYYGCGPELPHPGAGPTESHIRLLGVMLVLEKLGER